MSLTVSPGGAPSITQPSKIATLVRWYKADALALAEGDPVSAWANSEGTTDTLAQATGGNRPAYKSVGINGLPAVRFDGGDYLDASVISFSQPSTIFVVSKATSLTGARVLFDGITTRQSLYHNSGGNWELYAGSSASAGVATDTAWHYATTQFNGASSALWLDGAAVASSLNPSTNGLNGLRVGQNTPLSAGWVGDIAEIIIYSSLLSTADRQKVEAYLASKYFTTSTTLFTDTFASDTRTDYTYLSGASTDLAVGSGELSPANSGIRLFYPTSLAARKSSIVVAKTKSAASGRNYMGPACKIVDANNFVMAVINTDTAGIKLYEVVGGSLNEMTAVGLSLARDTYYWLLLEQAGKRLSCDIFSSDPSVDDSGYLGSLGTALNSARTSGRVGFWGNNPDNTAWKLDSLQAWPVAKPFDF